MAMWSSASTSSSRTTLVNAKFFQMIAYQSGFAHSSFLGTARLTSTTPRRSGTVCKMDEGVDLSPLDTKRTTLSPFQTAIVDFANPLPPPVTITRRPLGRDFAVLLMRSGYQSVDDLDFVAMDRFQQEFFEIRSLAWEKWIKVNSGMRQGLLTDARYFDFISYAQMMTIQKFMRQPYAVFEERYNVIDGHWDTRVVQRNVATLASPQDILEAFRALVGDKTYARMLDTVGYPAPVDGGNTKMVLDGIQDVYGYFQIGGFCFKLDFDSDFENRTCTVDMVAPAILWGAKALRKVRSIPNDYDVFAVFSFLRACNVDARVETIISGSSIVRRWSLM